MRLVAASVQNIPPGVLELLLDLGDGESGVGGTPVASGEMTVEQYVQRCVEMTDPANCPPGFVPQTVFWALDADGRAVGMVRMRHTLNEKLLRRGGHIGYYVRKDCRGRGYAREMLRLALQELRKLGVQRALLTADGDNLPSIRVILANGGVFENSLVEPDGTRFARYWIELN